MPPAVLWLRRDLRLGDHPALLAARDSAGANGSVLPVFVFDQRLWGPSGDPRRRFLLDCVADLAARTDGALVLRSGDPVRVIPRLVAEVGAGSVHVSADAARTAEAGTTPSSARSATSPWCAPGRRTPSRRAG
jgi:deoxyribodipyrimidine photo-lyase